MKVTTPQTKLQSMHASLSSSFALSDTYAPILTKRRKSIRTRMDARAILQYLDQRTAGEVDERLMSKDHGWNISQLMELAGLSCCEAVEDALSAGEKKKRKRALVLAGPGNNGGDGLVMAKHCAQRKTFEEIKVWYPKRGKKNRELFDGLVSSCEACGVTFHSTTDDELSVVDDVREYDVVVDAMFGFSFKGKPRVPYNEVVAALAEASVAAADKPFVVSIDIPSGDSVDDGPPPPGNNNNKSIHPDVLVSLTAPKKWVFNRTRRTRDAGKFANVKPCRHYLGGRFLSKTLISEFNEKNGVDLSRWNDMYSGRDQCVSLGLI